MKRLFSLLFALATFAPAFPALAASDYKWTGRETEDGASLSYAIPESDAIKLDFHCDRKSKSIAVSYEHEPKVARDGVQVKVRLSVRGRDSGVALEIPMKGERLELDDIFLLTGSVRMSPRLRRMLTEEGILVVTASGKTEEIPLKGAAQAARLLLANCP